MCQKLGFNAVFYLDWVGFTPTMRRVTLNFNTCMKAVK